MHSLSLLSFSCLTRTNRLFFMHSLSLLSFSCLTRTNRLFFPFVFSIDRSLRLLCFSLSLRSSISFKNLIALLRALCQSSTSASLESRTFMLFSLTFFPLPCRPSGQRLMTLTLKKKFVKRFLNFFQNFVFKFRIRIDNTS